MRLKLFLIFLLSSVVYGAPSADVLGQAKASSLWRPASLNDASFTWSRLLNQDANLANWNLEMTILYIRARTHDLNKRCIATQRALESGSVKKKASEHPAKYLGAILKVEESLWQDTSSVPTVIDLAASKRILEEEKYKDDLAGLRDALKEANKVNLTRTSVAAEARTAFNNLFVRKSK